MVKVMRPFFLAGILPVQLRTRPPVLPLPVGNDRRPLPLPRGAVDEKIPDGFHTFLSFHDFVKSV
jgi:hypothetical protein